MILNLVGQCGPLLGTNVYTSKTAPYYVEGHSICAAFLFFTTLLALALRTLLVLENKKLDRKFGTLKEQRARTASAEDDGKPGAEPSGVENYGAMYRYVL